MSMRIFERNLLRKSQQLFAMQVKYEKRDMERSLDRIETASGNVSNTIQRYADRTQSALNAINNAKTAYTFERFSEAVVRYLYLKKTLK